MNKYQNIHLASAVGALHSLYSLQPKSHTRIAVISQRLGGALLSDIGKQLPAVDSNMISLAEKIFPIIEKLIDDISKETKIPLEIIYVNLVSFNMEELPIKKKHSRLLSKLMDCFIDLKIYDYESIRTAHRIWQRLETEILIEGSLNKEEK